MEGQSPHFSQKSSNCSLLAPQSLELDSPKILSGQRWRSWLQKWRSPGNCIWFILPYHGERVSVILWKYELFQMLTCGEKENSNFYYLLNNSPQECALQWVQLTSSPASALAFPEGCWHSQELLCWLAKNPSGEAIIKERERRPWDALRKDSKRSLVERQWGAPLLRAPPRQPVAAQ